MCHSWPEDFSHCFSKPQNSAKEKKTQKMSTLFDPIYLIFSSRTTVFLASILPDLLTFEMKQHMLHIYVLRTLNISRIYELFKGKLIPVRNAFFYTTKKCLKKQMENFAELDCIRIYNVANMCVPVRTTRKCPK